MSNEEQGHGGGHGHEHEHTTTIVVNAQEKVVTGKEVSFEDLVALAYDGNPPTGENWEFTVTYRRGHRPKLQGSLVAGETVRVKKGMVFDVQATDKS